MGSSWRLSAIGRALRDTYNWLLPLAAINLTWFVLSLTVILMPPATAALYEIAYHASREPFYQPSLREDFLPAVRRWLLRSWRWGAAVVILVVVVTFALNFYAAQHNPMGDVLLVVSIAFTILLLLAQFFFWPYVFVQEKVNFWQAARNALFTILGDPFLALLNGGLGLLVLIVSIPLAAPLALITPVFVALLGTYSLRDWLIHHGMIEVEAGKPPQSEEG